MKWNDLAFWKKLSIAFGALLTLLIVSASLSVNGIIDTREQSLHT